MVTRASSAFALRRRDQCPFAISSFHATSAADPQGSSTGASFMERGQLGKVVISPFYASYEDRHSTRPPVGGRARVHFADSTSTVYFMSDIPTLGLLPTPLRCGD